MNAGGLSISVCGRHRPTPSLGPCGLLRASNSAFDSEAWRHDGRRSTGDHV